MQIQRQRQWRIQNQFAALNEYNLVKTAPPAGIYLTPTPSNFSLWSGIIFVREGPYSPAILRFQISFPLSYPAIPPLIVFTSDVFHPLITPLTTYTYSTSTPGHATVSSGDNERLLPGGLNLRHGFPKWFKSSAGVSSPGFTGQAFKDITPSPFAQTEREESSRPKPGHRRPLSFHMPPPKDDTIEDEDIPSSILEVLHYLKRVFEDEALLDELPLDMAAHPSAWYAWQAHRRKLGKIGPKVTSDSQKGTASPVATHARSKSDYSVPSASSSTSTPVGREQQQQGKKTMADWNWDGVWLARVKKGVNASLSDAVLFGNSDGDDLIHFLDVEDEEYSVFKDAWTE